MDDLESVLSGNDVDEPETEEAQQEPTGEASEIEESAPPVEETDDQPKEEDPKENAFYAKAQDEKRKRQQLEAELAQLRQQMEQPKEEVDYWDDPQKVIDQRLGSFETNVNSRFNALSEHYAKQMHSDYDEVMDYLRDEMPNELPHLASQAVNEVSPAEFLYKAAKAKKELAEVGDIDQLKAKLKAELLAEIETETKAKFEADLAKKSGIPQTLANQRTASTPTKGGEDSLEDILGR